MEAAVLGSQPINGTARPRNAVKDSSPKKPLEM